MIVGCEWLEWLEEDEEGNLTILKKDTPIEIKEKYEQILEEEKKSLKEKGIKNMIF